MDKPPLGATPAFVVSRNRIVALADAISRVADNPSCNLEKIRLWATEICMQCDIVELERRELKRMDNEQ